MNEFSTPETKETPEQTIAHIDEQLGAAYKLIGVYARKLGTAEDRLEAAQKEHAAEFRRFGIRLTIYGFGMGFLVGVFLLSVSLMLLHRGFL